MNSYEHKLEISIGYRGSILLDIKDVLKIEKENNHNCIYFRENSLKLRNYKHDEYFQDEFDKILLNKKIILDKRFYEEDIQEIKSQCSLLNQGMILSPITEQNKQRVQQEINRMNPSKNESYVKNVSESISQKKYLIPLFVLLYMTYNSSIFIHNYFEKYTSLIYFLVSIIGYTICLLIVLKVIKINKNHKLIYKIKEEQLIYINKERNIDVIIHPKDVKRIEKSVDGYVLIQTNGQKIYIDKGYSEYAMRNIIKEIKNTNNSIQHDL